MIPFEMDKFTIWCAGVFPNWRPDRAQAAAWAGELPNVKAEEVIQAVRKIMTRAPKPFPPSVFEIIAELRGVDKLDGRRSWQKVLGLVRRHGVGGFPMDELTAGEQEAVRLMGGVKIIGNSEEGDPFIEKRFLEVFDNVKEESNVLRIDGARPLRALGDGKGVRRVDQQCEDKTGMARRDA
jgi:hypothetical protein